MLRVFCSIQLASATVLFVGAVQAVTIDDFSSGPVTLLGPVGPIDQIGLDANHVVGGSRRISIGQGGSAPNTLDINVSLSQLAFATGSGPARGYLVVTYGALGPLDANLTAGGHDRIRLRVDEATNAPPFSAVFSIRDAASVATSFPLGSGLVALNGVGGIIEFSLGGIAADVTNISSITLNMIRYPVNGTLVFGEIVTAAPPLAGDYDRNGQVDGSDYEEWRRLFGQSVSGNVLLAADGNGNGKVDAADYTIWRDHLGASAGGTGAYSIPEPSVGQLTFIVVLLVTCAGRPWGKRDS